MRIPATCLGFLLLAAASPARAAVSAEAAAALGITLTPTGAEAAGNAAGTIPDWGGIALWRPEQLQLSYAQLQRLKSEQPAAVEPLLRPAEAATTPQFVITRANAAAHAAQLTAGHQALFERYPDYEMRVYPSLRGAFLPATVDAATRANATRARLNGTDRLTGARLGLPFPIPGNGAEAIWNHKLRFRGSAVRRFNNEVAVAQNGSFHLARIVEDVKLKYGDPGAPSPIEEGLILYYLQKVVAPARIAGQVLLVHETADQSTGGRAAWLYNPGVGRSRRAPNVGYDNPKASADGLMFNDQTDMFNGALDRYHWKLLGKREMYIAYNSTRMLAPTTTYRELIRKGHVNPELARYELHRVWVVEATLKPGTRHSFRRRTFYLDEDSWNIAAVDCYDDRGQLWRFQESHLATFPFVATTTGSPEVHHDLHSGRYFVTASYAGDNYPDFTVELEDADFSPHRLRQHAGERR